MGSQEVICIAVSELNGFWLIEGDILRGFRKKGIGRESINCIYESRNG